jgi:hypothetical protein
MSCIPHTGSVGVYTQQLTKWVAEVDNCEARQDLDSKVIHETHKLNRFELQCAY